ncbi:MAG: hypothetical protein JWL79_3723 [Frankiales bacterium]|nr:hypothetical protein [Frankiales bacterium]
MWLDNDGCVAGTGPVLVVVALTVDEQDPLAEELRHVAGLGDRLVIARLPYSQAEVRGEIERLVARFMRSSLSGVNGIGPDTKRGGITIMLPRPHEELERELAAATHVPVRIVYGFARAV